MKQAYIASPLRGDYDTNIRNAVKYCRLAAESGVLALAPHIIFSQWCNDAIPEQREQGLKLGLELLTHSEELWVMGEHISEGMRGEIAFAEEHGIPTFFMREPTVPLYYPISADENHLLSRMDCTPDGAKENYEGKMVLLRHENLAGKYRTPINQLWLCTHGPGCRPDFVHSDTIHLRHPVDDDYMAVGRGDVWGIPKPETLEWLDTLYPALVEKAALQAETAADEELCR